MPASQLPISLRKRTFNWVGGPFLLLTPPLAVFLSVLYVMREGFQWQIWLLAAVFYSLTASSITGGYHRCFAHRTYQSRTWLKWFWALFGAAAFQNSILVWARDHRIHHRFVDSDDDPYSINRGFFFAHFGWMMIREESPVNVHAYDRDLRLDPVVQAQERFYVPLAVAIGFVLPTLIGYFLGSALGGFAVAGLLRMVMLHHMTFFINSACHFHGKQTYTDSNTARDSVLLAIATFGEGYHNFHHLFDGDYRNGIRWYHWDPTKWMIQIFRLMGGAHSLKRAPWTEIIKAQMQMDEKRLKRRLDHKWHESWQAQLDGLKSRVESTHDVWEKLREEYAQLASSYAQSSRERVQEIRMQLNMAKIEFRAALAQWRTYNRFLMRTVKVKVEVIANA